MLKKIMKNVTALNAISNVLLQIVTLINGFLIPKLILNYFGSEVNGLVSSITQFLGYIYLIEGGITGVIMANLYKPLCDKDNERISSIVKTSQQFYKQISIFFIAYTLILGIASPVIFDTDFSYGYVSSLVIIMSLSLLIQYSFSITFRTLLNADKRVYIVSITQILILILNMILSYISLIVYPSVHILKLITGLVYVLQPIVFKAVINKKYSINYKAEEDKNLLKNRWSGFAINIAAFIHFNTDIAILNMFTNLKIVSVYSVYALVISGLRQIISSVSSAVSPTIGHLYAKGDMEELNKKFNLYELIIFIIVYTLFSVAILLITPFVLIYTKNIVDVNYNEPLLGVILLIAEAIYLIKTPHINLAYSANEFKRMTLPSYIEALLNIILSIILVNKIGIIGVAISTLIAMCYRTIYQIFFLKKNVINRPVSKFFGKVFIFTIAAIVGTIICKLVLGDVQISLSNWLLHGIIYSIIFIILYFFTTVIFYKDEYKQLKRYLKR